MASLSSIDPLENDILPFQVAAVGCLNLFGGVDSFLIYFSDFPLLLFAIIAVGLYPSYSLNFRLRLMGGGSDSVERTRGHREQLGEIVEPVVDY